MKKQGSQTERWSSRFGYLMVAAGASIGLGNVWKFPYLAYRGGGGIFILVYIIVILILAKPMVELETAIGRYGHADTVSVFEKIDKRWEFIGWIANVCTLMINFYYVVVGGWVLRYAWQFLLSGKFPGGGEEFFQSFISDPVQPIFWSIGLLLFITIILLFGITNYVEKISKVMLPALFILLIVCGIYACFSADGAITGLKYYLLPDFSKFNMKVFADVVTQALFSIGIGWGIFTTLGANISHSNNLRSDALFVSFSDTLAAILAGFVIIPAAFGAGVDVEKGPSLIFIVMTDIFNNLPGGRFIGAFFFIAICFAVFSSLFTFIEISVRTFEIKLHLGRKRAVALSTIIIGVFNILVSLGFGPLNTLKIPWISFTGVDKLGLYDWFDSFSGYVLLPLGCLLECYFCVKVWKFDNYEKELTVNGRDGRLTKWNKIDITAVIPIFMVLVILNVFGFIR